MEIPRSFPIPHADQGGQEKRQPITELAQVSKPELESVTEKLRDISPLYTEEQLIFPSDLIGRERPASLINTTLNHQVMSLPHTARAFTLERYLKEREITSVRDFLTKMPTGDAFDALLAKKTPLSDQLHIVLQELGTHINRDLLPFQQVRFLSALYGVKNSPLLSPEKERAVRPFVNERVEKLPGLESVVLVLKYGLYDGEPKFTGEVAKLIGKSEEKVHQFEERATRKLRNSEDKFPQEKIEEILSQ